MLIFHFEYLNVTDLNECALFPNICQNGVCKNTIGSFECSCNDGYENDERGLNCTGILKIKIILYLKNIYLFELMKILMNVL